MSPRLTALGEIADNMKVANDAAFRCRNDDRKHAAAYREGEAAAYDQAYGIMKAELQRLRNLLQNGSLTQADFGDDLP